jgi:UDP-N-acetyl-2-amino-2-deoxyglucuronate dehydrogenase
MAGNETRIGVIGVGAIGPCHAYAIEQVDGCSLSAVCDVREDAAKAFAEEKNVPYFTSVEDMLAAGVVDAVTLSTPSGFHMESVLAAIENDTHVLVEKPLEITTERIDQIIDAERQSNAIVACVYQSRFRPVIRKMKALFDNGLLGEVYSGSVYIKRYRTQDYYDSGGWRGTWQVDGGGCLMNQGIHDVDLFVWFMGDVEEVIAITESYGRDIEVETLALALVKFKRGARGHLEGTTLAYPEFSPYIEAYGSRGTVAFTHSRLMHMEIMDPTDEEIAARDELYELTRSNDERKANAPKVAAGTPVASLDMGHAPVVADFVDAIRTGRKPFVTSHDARKAVTLIRAIYESGRNGSKPVHPA